RWSPLKNRDESDAPTRPRRSGGLPIRDRFSRDVCAQNLASDIRDEIINAANVAVIASATDVHADAGISKEPGKRHEKRRAVAGKQRHDRLRPLAPEFVEPRDETAVRRSRVAVMGAMHKDFEIEIRTESCHQVFSNDGSRSQNRIVARHPEM